tara:strand:+ start:542 stop:2284 length:1743 start_codon:yes stop_codon:yes gene_type:complete
MNHPLLQKASIVYSPTANFQNLGAGVPAPPQPACIKPARSLGNDVVINGGFDADSNWTKGDGWSISNGVASCDGTQSSFSFLFQSGGNYKVGQFYEITYTVTSFTAGRITVGFGDSSNISDLASQHSGTPRTTAGTFTQIIEINRLSGDADAVFFVVNPGGKNPGFVGSIDNVIVKKVTMAQFDFQRNTTATIVNESGLIETVAIHIPRIDYLSGVGVYLHEPTSTNTATYSNDFTQGDIFDGSSNPFLNQCVLTANSITAPDGTNNGWKLTDSDDGGSGISRLQYSNTIVTSGDSNTFSIFLKKGSTDFAYIRTVNYDTSANGDTFFNLNTGSISLASANHSDVKMENYGNGWYRCTISIRTTTDVSGRFDIGIATSSGITSITRDGTNFIYMFGVQAEANGDTDIDSFLTSYIPTNGATTTRLGDSMSNAGNTDLINSTEGVFYVNLAGLARKFKSTRRIALCGNSSNEIRVDFGNSEDRVTLRVRANGNNVATTTQTVTDISQFHKYAIQWKENDFKFYIDGVQVATDTIGATYTANTLDRVNLATSTGSSKMEGKIKCIAVFKQTLTDAELVTLTS